MGRPRRDFLEESPRISGGFFRLFFADSGRRGTLRFRREVCFLAFVHVSVFGREFSIVVLAAAASLGGTLAVIAVPAFAKNLYGSHLVEAEAGLQRIGVATIARTARGEPLAATTPRTPEVVPRGVAVIDPPGTWDHPTWVALAFAPVDAPRPLAHAHRFSFAFENQGNRFKATANGDLDGDGTSSILEIEGSPDKIAPGMYVENELE